MGRGQAAGAEPTDDVFRVLFEASGEAITLADLGLHTILDANPAACRMFGYTRDELIGLRTADLVHPESLEVYLAHAGQQHQQLALVGRRKDGSPFEAEVSVRVVRYQGQPARCAVIRELTDQARAFELLESRVAQRTRELVALVQVSRAVSATLEVQPLLGVVLDQLAAVVGYTEAGVHRIRGDQCCVAEYRGPRPRARMLELRVPVEGAPMLQAALRRGAPVIIHDLEAGTELAEAVKAAWAAPPAAPPGTDHLLARALLAVPLVAMDRPIGEVWLAHGQPGYYTQAHADLALAIANQAAMAIESARLFEEGERRRRELELLYSADEALYSSLEPRNVLGGLVDAATKLLGADKASLLLWDAARQQLTVRAARGVAAETLRQMSYRIDEGRSTLAEHTGEIVVRDGLSTLAWQTGEIIATDNAQTDPRISARLRAIHAANGILGMICVPIKLGHEAFGVFNLQYSQPRAFSADDRRLLEAFAQRAAIALHNARLFEAERATRERLDVALVAGRMGAWEWDIRTNRVSWSTQLEAIHGLQPGTFAGTFDAYLADIHPDDLDRVRQTIAESLRGGEHHLEYRIVWPDGSVRWVEVSGRAIRDEAGATLGMRGVCQDITDRKRQEAEQIRLRALEERQRLARELHDSVSQALYGIALGAQTALAELGEDRGPQPAEHAVTYVHRLAEAAISEMRALIFELRPEALERDGLVAVLERQVAALRARHALQVDAVIGQEPAVALDKKEALYRIAQESLHNAARHARARTLRLSLQQTGGHVRLEVADDGVGFDPSAAYPGHLGLVSMRERAAAAGGALLIQSAPGAGTRITADLPL